MSAPAAAPAPQAGATAAQQEQAVQQVVQQVRPRWQTRMYVRGCMHARQRVLAVLFQPQHSLTAAAPFGAAHFPFHDPPLPASHSLRRP